MTEVISVAETSCLIAPAHTKHRKAVTAAMSCNSGVQALRPILRLFSPSFLLLFFSFGIELWVFGVSERFFFSFFLPSFFDSIAAQDQHTQLHSRNKEKKNKCRSISSVCKTSFRWNASRMSRQPASAFVLFLFLSSLFHLSFFLIFFFSCQSQLFGVIDDQGNIPIVLRLFRNHFLILLCFVTFCVWCFCEMQFRVRETVQAPF